MNNICAPFSFRPDGVRSPAHDYALRIRQIAAHYCGLPAALFGLEKRDVIPIETPLDWGDVSLFPGYQVVLVYHIINRENSVIKYFKKLGYK